MEDESADLDTLTRVVVDMGGIAESGMGDPACAAVELGVETLDQRDLVGLLAVEEVPLVVRIGPHRQRLALARWVDQSYGDEVRVRDRVCVGHGERVLEDLLDRAPHVDDLVPGL